jgi:hypothetical protein
LNRWPDGASAVFATIKPFDVPVKGLDFSKSRGDRTPVELFVARVGLRSLETRVLLVSEP